MTHIPRKKKIILPKKREKMPQLQNNAQKQLPKKFKKRLIRMGIAPNKRILPR
jgi:hypothetical protein